MFHRILRLKSLQVLNFSRTTPKFTKHKKSRTLVPKAPDEAKEKTNFLFLSTELPESTFSNEVFSN